MRKTLWVVFMAGIGLINAIGLTDPASSQSGSPRQAGVGNPGTAARPMRTLQAPPKPIHPKMDSSLSRFRDTYTAAGLAAAMDAPVRQDMDLDGDKVLVVSELQTQGTTRDSLEQAAGIIEARITELNGKVELRFEHLIQHWIPVSELNRLADMPEIRYIRLPQRPQPDSITEGVNLTGANLWQQLPNFHAPQDVTICVLDIGFAGYQTLKGRELPDSIETRSFRADGNIEAVTEHGTACAEIVHAMAPDANLVLCNCGTDVECMSAVDWIIARKFSVVSHSVGYFNTEPGNGTGPVNEVVKKASENGVVWINSAGNYAQQHWAGTYTDPDGDGWHNFSGTDEMLNFQLPANVAGRVFLKWDDWGSWNGTSFSGSNQDYDLYVYYWSGTSWVLWDESMNVQSGTQLPVEYVGGFWSSNSSRTWGVSIRRYTSTRNVNLDLTITPGYNLDYVVSGRSLSSPADSAYAFAVGATDWQTDAYESYSSQGPTMDGRIKPDLSAPSGVSTITYGSLGFSGTSASAPHVAGAVALLLGKTSYTPEQVMKIIQSRVLDLGPPGKDNQFGLGRLLLTR